MFTTSFIVCHAMDYRPCFPTRINFTDAEGQLQKRVAVLQQFTAKCFGRTICIEKRALTDPCHILHVKFWYLVLCPGCGLVPVMFRKKGALARSD